MPLPRPLPLGGGTPDPTPFGSYGASISAPAALMLGAFGLHPRTLAHGEVKVGALSQFVPLKLGGIDAPIHLSTTTNLSVLFALLINTTSSPINAPPTLVLAHSVALLLPFGTQFLSISAHCKPLMPSNTA